MMMSQTRYGVALILSGASGTGKSTVLHQVRSAEPQIAFSVSCTTRQPRPGETDGRDYRFLDVETFQRHIRNHDFLEYAEVHGNFYGTLKSELLDRVQNGCDVILDIDVQGAAQIRKSAQEDELLSKVCRTLFLAPPSFAELERRLRGRGTETETVIQRRLTNAKAELGQWRDYEFVIVNDDASAAAERFLELLRTLRRQTALLREAPFDV